MVDTLMWFQMILAVALIIIVLLQFGKGAEAGLLSAGDSVMSGSQKGNILTKITVVISFFFFANSVYLAKIQSSKSEKSLLDSESPVASPFNNDAARAEQKANADAAKPETAKNAAQTEPAPGSAAAPKTEPAPKAEPAKPAAPKQ
jgi:preprotein translocase subunit SecG